MDIVAEEPNFTICRLVFCMGISTFVVWWTLHEQGLHPYHLQRVSALEAYVPVVKCAYWKQVYWWKRTSAVDPLFPELNSMWFFLWGHMKGLAYAAPVNSVEELTARVNAVAETIRRNSTMSGRMQESMARRIQAYIKRAIFYTWVKSGPAVNYIFVDYCYRWSETICCIY